VSRSGGRSRRATVAYGRSTPSRRSTRYSTKSAEGSKWSVIVPEPGHTSVPGSLASIDHIKARGLGGTNVASNLRVICTGCNNDKARGESQAVEARRKMYRERALKAARTRARNKAEAVRREALAAYHKARSRGASERAACAAAAARRAELEGKRR